MTLWLVIWVWIPSTLRWLAAIRLPCSTAIGLCYIYICLSSVVVDYRCGWDLLAAAWFGWSALEVA